MIIVCPECGAKNRVPEEKLSSQPACGQCHQSLIPLKPIDLNEQNFSNFVSNSDLPILVDLWAEWCGPCKMIAPVLDELAKDYDGKLSIVKVNVDENTASPAKFGIRGIPTLLLFKNGTVMGTKVGAASKSQLAAFIDSHI